jgi:hypothetical protein
LLNLWNAVCIISERIKSKVKEYKYINIYIIYGCP